MPGVLRISRHAGRISLHKTGLQGSRTGTVPPVMYAVYSDYETDWRGEYSYLIGCGVDRAGAIPEGMEVRRVPAQTYAVLRAKGGCRMRYSRSGPRSGHLIFPEPIPAISKSMTNGLPAR